MADTLTVDVVDSKGKKAGTADLPAEVFDVVTNVPLIHQVVVAQRASGAGQNQAPWCAPAGPAA